MAPIQFQFQQGAWFCTHPCTFWRNQGHHVNHLKFDFVQSISLPKKMKVFDFVLMLPEGHKQLNAMNVKYVEICDGSGPLFGTRCKEYTILGIHIMGSGPLLESCRPQLGVHKMAHQNPWECHFVHPQGAKKRGSCTKWGSPCRFGMIWMCTKWFFQPPNAISVQNGDCWFDVNLCTKWIFGRVFQMRCTNLVAPIVLKPNFPVQNVNDQPLGKNKLKSVQNASKSVRNERLHFVLQTSRGIENQDIALVSQSGKLLLEISEMMFG